MSHRTKRAMEEAFMSLLRKKPIEKITISDIADECGINRMTFYYHFKDINDLMEWCLIEDAARALDGKRTYDTWQQGFLQIFKRALENKPLILNVYHSNNYDQLEQYLYKLCFDLLIGVIDEQAAASGIRANEEDKRFIADFYKYAFVGLMFDWIRRGMTEDPARIIERLSILIRGDFQKALTGFAASQPIVKNE